MAEYKIKGGYILNDEGIERLGEACERGEYPGDVGAWVIDPQESSEVFDVISPEDEQKILNDVEAFRAGKLKTYSLEEVKAHCGLDSQRPKLNDSLG